MISISEPFEKTIFEVNNRFGMHRESENSWDIAQGIVRDLGGSALNVGGTTLAGDQIGWGRSSMTKR